MTPVTPDGITETGRLDPAEFTGKPRRAPANRELGTALLRFVTVELPGGAAS